MKPITKISNNCTECAYFVRHYANIDGKFYPVTGCLHCINQDLTIREQKKRLNNLVACKLWQPKQLQINKRKSNISETIRRMCGLLEDIAVILKDDNKSKKDI
ncbi:MAG: hypothetical protein NC183_02620 [Corallococcus sp.]|nr:hypothetical protein [Corallococcus sp.]MCM1359409.1 hypothetical protein [Corallococcus sp.]